LGTVRPAAPLGARASPALAAALGGPRLLD